MAIETTHSGPRGRRRQLRLEEDAPNKHQVKTDEMRRKLLKSARKIFVRDGFEGARLEEIAADAGHTRGAFYAHFGSKEELFFALLEEQIYKQLNMVQLLMEAESTPAAKLRALGEHYVAKAADPSWSMLMLEFKLFAVRRPKVRARLAAAHQAMRAAVDVRGLANLVAAGRPADAIPYESVRVILESFLQSLILQRAYDPTALSSQDAARALRDVFNVLLLGK